MLRRLLTLWAWPDIQKWMLSLAGRLQKENYIDGYNIIVPFLTIVAKKIEAEEWFIKEDRSDPSISAADPFTNLAAQQTESNSVWNSVDREEGSPFDFLPVLEDVCTEMEWDPAETARTALAHLRSKPVSLELVEAHLAMLYLVSFVPSRCSALLAQHSVRDATRVLADLTLKPYASDSAPQTADCIVMCLMYLDEHLPLKDGLSNVRMALLAGILPAILRCNRWISEDSQIDDLGLVDDTQLISAVYQKLVNLIAERRAMVRPKDKELVDLSVRCTNCAKLDIGGDFKACSGCFLVSYCSEGCQKEDWAAHEGDCRMVQNLREEGEPIPMLPDDLEYLNQFAMEQVNQHRVEIARVWKEEQPTRTPLVSFDFNQNPEGVMVVGKRCMDTVPGNMGRGAEREMDVFWY
ncbi:hypothetical protein C8R44DRAFT_730615 [Mycena epipterygia]|nr:hypothetical protein C8R44DRAFT_730615 [Mycena epipterygia]